MSEQRILVIDDDSRLVDLLRTYLEQNGISVAHAKSGVEGLTMLEAGGFDGVLLDIMLPGLDGLSVLKRIREHKNLPVIMLTAKGDETDRVVGLELGADDYLPKPFSPRELLARVRAVLRRSQVSQPSQELLVGGVRLELDSRRVWVGERSIELTGLEFDLLRALMLRAGRVVPRASLLDYAGRSDLVVGDRTVDVHISHLRKKLGDDPPNLIKTVRGVGYVMAKA